MKFTTLHWLGRWVVVALLWAATAAAETRVGVYFGSFDPVTISHTSIMKSAIQFKKLDRLIVGVNMSGAKDFKASFAERAEMIRISLGALAHRVEVVPVWQENKEAFVESRAGPGVELYQFIGQDSFEKIPGGPRPEGRYVVFPRPSQGTQPLVPGPNVEILVLESPEGVSSSIVRERLEKGDYGIRYLDPAVESYIQGRGLYLGLAPLAARFRETWFRTQYQEFLQRGQELRPDLNWGALTTPLFNPTQSWDAWRDKFRRLLVENAEALGADWREMDELGQTVVPPLDPKTRCNYPFRRVRAVGQY